ncbi:hypothetical protein H5410_040695 [Solanum commersonii]|uniref:Uncharacterized protein n=1 Tax=Solanum commersonii TaxID=4109 RepID=A0A9J5XQV6_SOLCO|nr:hypothetical protein H5410_040695 [Solanum commersonii]
MVLEQATLTLDVEDREICMDPRKGTYHSPPGERDRFPSEAHGESTVPLVPAFPAPVEGRGDAVPPNLTSSIGTRGSYG